MDPVPRCPVISGPRTKYPVNSRYYVLDSRVVTFPWFAESRPNHTMKPREYWIPARHHPEEQMRYRWPPWYFLGGRLLSWFLFLVFFFFFSIFCLDFFSSPEAVGGWMLRLFNSFAFCRLILTAFFWIFFFFQIRSAKSADTSLATTSRVAMLNKVLSTVVRMLQQVCTHPTLIVVPLSRCRYVRRRVKFVTGVYLFCGGFALMGGVYQPNYLLVSLHTVEHNIYK